MAVNDVIMGLSVGSLVGVVVGGLLGFVFLFSCIVSAVKAVRDRQQIKARIQAKRAGQASGNGHAPGADVPASQGGGRKGRPNILIIHDGEREERVKRGADLGSSASSPRPPSGLSSPGERASRQTETTTLAEVACHRSDSLESARDPPALDGKEEVGSHHLHTPPAYRRCLLPGQVGDMDAQVDVVNDDDDAVAKDDVDIAGEVVTYRSSSRCSMVTTFPVTRSCHPDGDNADNHRSPTGESREGAGPRPPDDDTRGHHLNCRYSTNDHVMPRGPTAEHGQHASSVSFHGFTKHCSKSKWHHALKRGADTSPDQPRYNLRRNSYAAAIANDAWVDVPPVRRHSDEPRHHVSSSSLVVRQETGVRALSQDCTGTDNLAYEGADEKGVV